MAEKNASKLTRKGYSASREISIGNTSCTSVGVYELKLEWLSVGWYSDKNL